jgi:hypothetical protein
LAVSVATLVPAIYLRLFAFAIRSCFCRSFNLIRSNANRYVISDAGIVASISDMVMPSRSLNCKYHLR